MRRPAGDERRTLLDAEAVLLVDDGDREVAQLEALLDKCVGADDDVGSERRLPLALAGRAREERAADAELEAEVGDREEVLLGERLGRCHERSLASGLDRTQERVQGDHGLAGADVALQEPLHRQGALEVAVDLADRLLLVGRERERQRLPVAVDELARFAKARRERSFAFRDAARDPDLQDEQLLERQPLPPGLGLVEVPRPVHGGERVTFQRQSLALAQLGRQRIRDVHGERKGGVHDASHGRGGDLFRGRVDGSEVGGGACFSDVVRARLEAPAAQLPP